MKVHDTSQQDKKLMTFFSQKKQRTSDQKLSRGFAMEDKEGPFFFHVAAVEKPGALGELLFVMMALI